MKPHHKTCLLLSLILLFVIIAFAICCGAVFLPPGELWGILRGEYGETDKTILISLRLPRVLLAAFVGAGLSVVGAFLQGLLRNPLADPYVLGVSSGAAFGATLAIIGGLGFWGIESSAFLFALLTISAVYLIAKTGTRVSMTSMLLAGIAVSAFMSSIISLLMLLNHNELSRIVFWTMGSFGLVFWSDLLYTVPPILVGSLVMYAFARDLNVIMSGEEIAENLGIDTERVKKIILAAGSLITAAAVCATGIIGFVGLIIPHICRLLIGPDNRVLVPFSALCGAAFLILTDTMARTILAPAEIPVGIITAGLGGPFFIYLLVKTKKKNEGM